MSDAVQDRIVGLACSTCGIYFDREHGFPVVCNDCAKDLTKSEMTVMGVQRAIYKEL